MWEGAGGCGSVRVGAGECGSALWSGPLGKFFEFFGIIASIGRKTSRI